MRKWVNGITFAAIAIVIIATNLVLSSQYEWINGNIALPNFMHAFTDTRIDILYENTVTGKQLKQTVTLKKMVNNVPFSMMIPDDNQPFTLRYSLESNDETNIMFVAYQATGALDSERSTVPLNQASEFVTKQLKGYVIRFLLLENAAAWQESIDVLDSLWVVQDTDKQNVERIIDYVRKNNPENPQRALRWILCHADTESEFFWGAKAKDQPLHLMNAIFLEGVYNFIDLEDPNGQLMDRTAMIQLYPIRIFEHGVER